jgi:hypothetical protein
MEANGPNSIFFAHPEIHFRHRLPRILQACCGNPISKEREPFRSVARAATSV